MEESNTTYFNKKFSGPLLIFSGLIICCLFVFIAATINLSKALLFLTGCGLGIVLLQSTYGFTGSWRNFIVAKDSLGIRSNLLLLALASVLFFPLVGHAFPAINVNAALAPVGISVIFGAFIFGIGMQMGGGCGSGTLFTFGQGQLDMIITLVFFIVGATVGSVHLNWWLALPSLDSISLIQTAGWLEALVFQLIVLLLLYRIVHYVDSKSRPSVTPLFKSNTLSFTPSLFTGPWPLWWGVVGLLFFSTLTLLLAGHTWSVTFAFGLWGTKIWQAVGGDTSTWAYWATGYPAQALNQSVLLDTTSVMDFGVILGAFFASVISGRFSPNATLQLNRFLSAILGGLLLGYGARLAFGCNIGALFSGIATGSLHGWIWLVFAFLGNIVGVQFRQILNGLGATK